MATASQKTKVCDISREFQEMWVGQYFLMHVKISQFASHATQHFRTSKNII